MSRLLAFSFAAVMILSAFSTVVVAQSSVGIGAGFYTYATHWYRYNSGGSSGSRESWPAHLFSRTEAIAYYESPNIVSLGPVKLSLVGEFHYGISGETKEDWLPAGETVSSGGNTIVGVAGVKLQYPLPIKNLRISPYLLPMFHYSLLNSNGQGVGTQYASRAEYGYTYEWDEEITAFSLGIGVQARFGSFVISPEYRFYIDGGAASGWDPAGWVEDTGPDFGAFVIKAGLAL